MTPRYIQTDFNTSFGIDTADSINAATLENLEDTDSSFDIELDEAYQGDAS